MTGGIGAMKNTRFEDLFSSQLPPEVQLRRVQQIIRQELTDLQREALVGIYFQGLTITQIARRRGVCPSTVYRTLKRGEQKLRRFLKY